MLRTKLWARLIGASAVVLILAGCSTDDDETTAPESRTGSIRLSLNHVVGAESLVLHSIEYTNAFGNVYGIEELEYFLSEFELRGPDGDVPVDLVHYVNGDDDTTLEFEIDGIPEGHYDDIVFTFGLNEEMNVAGALPETEANRNMFWPDNLGGGYHYMRILGRYLDPADAPIGFKTHTGRLMEDGTAYPHFFQVTMSPDMDLARNTVKDVEIIVDINEWYANPHTINLADHAAGIMANTPAQDLLEENGASVFRLGDVTDE